jgi:hypothetical protein
VFYPSAEFDAAALTGDCVDLIYTPTEQENHPRPLENSRAGNYPPREKMEALHLLKKEDQH